jgi:hypothetical protein
VHYQPAQIFTFELDEVFAAADQIVPLVDTLDHNDIVFWDRLQGHVAHVRAIVVEAVSKNPITRKADPRVSHKTPLVDRL